MIGDCSILSSAKGVEESGRQGSPNPYSGMCVYPVEMVAHRFIFPADGRWRPRRRTPGRIKSLLPRSCGLRPDECELVRFYILLLLAKNLVPSNQAGASFAKLFLETDSSCRF